MVRSIVVRKKKNSGFYGLQTMKSQGYLKRPSSSSRLFDPILFRRFSLDFIKIYHYGKYKTIFLLLDLWNLLYTKRYTKG